MEKKRVLICLHGFKGPTGSTEMEKVENEIGYLFDEVVYKSYYMDNDSKSINQSGWDKRAWEQYKEFDRDDVEVTILGFSIGSSVGIGLAVKFSNVKDIIFISPVYKLQLAHWPVKLVQERAKKKKLKKSMGAERYNKIFTNPDLTVDADGNKLYHPVKTALQIGYYRLAARRGFKNIKNATILFIIPKWEETAHVPHLFKFIDKNLHKTTKYERVEGIMKHENGMFDNIVPLWAAQAASFIKKQRGE